MGRAEPASLLLVLDTSGTMRGTPLEEAKRAAVALLDQMAPEDRVTVMTFNDETELIADLNAQIAAAEPAELPPILAISLGVPVFREQLHWLGASVLELTIDETNAFVQKVWASRRIGEIIDEIDLQGKNQELIDELIKLSTKHGILTPYTSFLADDNVSPQDFASNRGRANLALKALEEDSGEAGFAQRAAKARFQQSAQAPAGGAAVYSSAKSDKSVAVHTIQNVGNKTFFYRNQCWIDSTATEDRKKNARKITRYSDEYFELVTRYGKHVAKYLALEGHVIVVLNGQAYEF